MQITQFRQGVGQRVGRGVGQSNGRGLSSLSLSLSLGSLLLAALFSLTGCSNDFHNWGKDKGGTPPPPKYTVSFNGNGAERTPSPISGITGGSTIADPSDPVWTDNVFLGWWDSGYNSEYTFPLTITANTTLYAKWQYTATELSNIQNIQDFGTTTGITEIKG
ncbi:hypothetical protein FACS189487_11400 [Campylobacterota bacterium]|nr:hypothetical protein FACS189487_11400 [Campylobacterota bacterium]